MISTVAPDSPAEKAGIRKGDELISINDRPVRDVIDFRFHSSDTRLDIRLRRRGREVQVLINKGFDDSLGIDFTRELFDGVRTCRNRCVFCFVDNLPRGMRRSLYIKDDDYRLSFLHGNFVTLSNLSDTDVDRIIEQGLSPLYVSVHATRPELRSDLLRPRDCPDILPLLRKLAEGRIRMHAQIVLCPGVNDGEHLDRTIDDLAELYPAIQSIGVVPVGLTKYTKAQELGPYSYTSTRAIPRKVEARQRRFREEQGTRLVYASDELYLSAGRRLPGAAAYEGYPQYENGIGIARSFVDDMRRVAKRLPAGAPDPVHVGLITGKLAEPFVRELADTLNHARNVRVEVYPVVNDFFGDTVTVAGLLTGRDIIRQLQLLELPERLFVPTTMLRDDAFLDDITLPQVGEHLGRQVIAVKPTPGDLAAALGLT
ncbi:MAG: DUF512 domain-containing protein [Armatimonadota bacterium]|nr:DUF512 domain-containing protein [Armatimonadota bacterium]